MSVAPSTPLWVSMRTGRPGTGWAESSVPELLAVIADAAFRTDIPPAIRATIIIDAGAALAVRVDPNAGLDDDAEEGGR